MARTRKRCLWVDLESTYGADPSTNGSAYLWVPAFSVGDIGDGKVHLPTNYFTGRVYDTAPVLGADGWNFEIEIPVIGLATAAGDGATPGTDDWFDYLLKHIFGTQTVKDGEGFASSSTTSSWILDTDAFNAQDILAAYESGVPSGAERTQLAVITSDPASGTYAVAPTADAAPTTAAVAYGYKQYTFDDDGGNSLAWVYQQDDQYYSLLGSRCTSASLSAKAGEIVKMKLAFAGDTATATDTSTKSALPAASSGPAVAPIKAFKSPFYFNGTKIVTQSINIDFGLETAQLDSTQATNMRADFQLIRGQPSLTVEPLYTDTLLNLKRNATTGRMLMQLGAGQLSGGAINLVGCHWAEAYCSETSRLDASGVQRQSLKFMLSDAVTVGGAAARAFQMIRV